MEVETHRTVIHPRRRSSSGSTSVPPPRRHIKDANTSSMDRELDSIRSQRAHLHALTTSIRLPPLTPKGVLGTRTSPLFNHKSRRNLLSGDRQLRRRQRADISSSSKTSTASGRMRSRATKLPALSISSATPGKPYRNPLPEIGHVKNKLDKEEEIHFVKANVESPPPSTYEETLKVSQWMEKISQASIVETSPSLKSPENRETLGKEKVDFTKIVSDMGSEDLQIQLQATLKARQLLSDGITSSIGDFLEANILTPALANLQKEDAILLFETVWIITNIASGDTSQTQALVDQGFLKAMVQLLYSNDARVQEQVIWALSNIAADGPELRNKVVAAGVIKPSLALIAQDMPRSLLNNLSWMLCNIFRTKDLVMPEEEKSLILQTMREHLLTHQDFQNVHVDALSTISYYTDMGNDYIQKVVEGGIVPLLVRHLQSSDLQIQKAALRALGNIITGTDTQTDVALEAGILPVFHQLLVGSSDESIKREAAWSLSNILAGTPNQIQMVIDEGILPALVESVQKDEFSVRRESTWALANMTDGGTKAQIRALVSAGGLQQLASTMITADAGMALLGADGIWNILRKSDDVDAIKIEIEECGGLDTMEAYQDHEDKDLVDKVNDILYNYFSDSLDLDIPISLFEDNEIDYNENHQDQ